MSYSEFGGISYTSTLKQVPHAKNDTAVSDELRHFFNKVTGHDILIAKSNFSSTTNRMTIQIQHL